MVFVRRHAAIFGSPIVQLFAVSFQSEIPSGFSDFDCRVNGMDILSILSISIGQSVFELSVSFIKLIFIIIQIE